MKTSLITIITICIVLIGSWYYNSLQPKMAPVLISETQLKEAITQLGSQPIHHFVAFLLSTERDDYLAQLRAKAPTSLEYAEAALRHQPDQLSLTDIDSLLKEYPLHLGLQISRIERLLQAGQIPEAIAQLRATSESHSTNSPLLDQIVPTARAIYQVAQLSEQAAEDAILARFYMQYEYPFLTLTNALAEQPEPFSKDDPSVNPQALQIKAMYTAEQLAQFRDQLVTILLRSRTLSAQLFALGTAQDKAEAQAGGKLPATHPLSQRDMCLKQLIKFNVYKLAIPKQTAFYRESMNQGEFKTLLATPEAALTPDCLTLLQS